MSYQVIEECSFGLEVIVGEKNLRKNADGEQPGREGRNASVLWDGLGRWVCKLVLTRGSASVGNLSKLDPKLLLHSFTPVLDLQEGCMRFVQLPSLRSLPVASVPSAPGSTFEL